MVADALAFDSILLSDKFQGRGVQVGKSVVIQGRVGSIVHHASNGKVDVSELEGLRASVGSASAAAFGGSEWPEESHNDEVNDVSVESSADSMVGVNDVRE